MDKKLKEGAATAVKLEEQLKTSRAAIKDRKAKMSGVPAELDAVVAEWIEPRQRVQEEEEGTDAEDEERQAGHDRGMADPVPASAKPANKTKSSPSQSGSEGATGAAGSTATSDDQQKLLQLVAALPAPKAHGGPAKKQRKEATQEDAGMDGSVDQL